MTSALFNVMRGRVWKFGESVDTDIIAPGRAAPMSALRPEFSAQVKPGDIVVAGRNFACGSHRESANRVLRDAGVQAVVAESIARIFFRVGISFGQPLFIAPGVTTIVEDGDELEIDYGAGVARNVRTAREVRLVKYPPSVEGIYDSGGIIPLFVQRYLREAAEAGTPDAKA